MNEITNHAELTVELKKEGKYLRNRWLMISAYIFGFILILGILFALNLGLLGLIMVPAYPFLLSKLIVPITFCYVDIEKKMDISGGNLTLSTIYGKRKKVDNIVVKVSQLDAIMPYRDEYKKIADEYDATLRYEAVSSMSHPDVYFAYYTNEKGEKVILFFEVVNKALKVLKFLNSKTVVVEVSR